MFNLLQKQFWPFNKVKSQYCARAVDLGVRADEGQVLMKRYRKSDHRQSNAGIIPGEWRFAALRGRCKQSTHRQARVMVDTLRRLQTARASSRKTP